MDEEEVQGEPLIGKETPNITTTNHEVQIPYVPFSAIASTIHLASLDWLSSITLCSHIERELAHGPAMPRLSFNQSPLSRGPTFVVTRCPSHSLYLFTISILQQLYAGLN
ncbi:hypothetical protein L1887_35338 [Cichorium endivia]|nr:hypothetical protein L1887_35338 [Cichorium endivia]